MSPEDSAAAKKAPRVRLATAKDAPAIMALLRVMHAEIGMASLNEAKVAKKIQDVLERGVICLALADGRPVGTCALEFSQMWYSDDHHLAETWFFVHPDNRQSRNAARLMRFANEIARQLQLPVLMGVATNKETQRKCDFFGRYMRSVGQLFVGGHV
jgi:N-acetylglutamate synthase-like GNAT family acetyltransferase